MHEVAILRCAKYTKAQDDADVMVLANKETLSMSLV